MTTPLDTGKMPDSQNPFKTDPNRNFPEDYNQENGNYMNKCFYCKNYFTGNKHRFSCKLCDAGSIEYWTVVSQTKKPEDNKCAHAGCWSQGEMTGYAKCMIDKYFPLQSELTKLREENERLQHWQDDKNAEADSERVSLAVADIKESLSEKVKEGVEAIWERDFFKNKVKELESRISELEKENTVLLGLKGEIIIDHQTITKTKI